MEKEIVNQLKEIIKLNPKNKLLKKNLKYLEKNGTSKYIDTINKFYKTYKDLIIEYYIELNLSLEKASINSINIRKLIKTEIKNINTYLQKAKKTDLIIFDWSNIFDLNPKKATELYSKMLRGLEIEVLFNGKVIPYDEFESMSKVRALIFYKENLKRLKTEYNTSIQVKKTIQTDNVKPSLKEIALIHIYNRVQITRENGDEIANNNGYKSGERLYQYFSHFSSMSNRKGKTNPFTKKKMENKIELFEKVVNVLTGKAYKWALDELTILKTIYESEFKENL